jgi:hypothetical protein
VYLVFLSILYKKDLKKKQVSGMSEVYKQIGILAASATFHAEEKCYFLLVIIQ